MPNNTYQIQPGDNLSTIAQNNGTTVQDILNANSGNTSAIPNASNPNLILAGGTLNLPGVQTNSSVASSTPAAGLTNTAITNLNNSVNSTNPNNNNNNNNSNDFSMLSDITGDTPSGYYEAQSQLIDTQYEGFITALNNYKTENDNLTNRLIENIQQRFEIHRQNQTKTNKALEAGTFIGGIRSGRSRYATENQDALIAAEHSAGIQRLAQLDVEENSAIIEALTAKSERDYDILVTKMDQADKVREQKRKVLLDIYDLALQQEEIANQRTANMMDNLKLEQSQLTDVAYAILDDYRNSDNPDQFLNNYAQQYGINPTTLKGVIEQVKADQFSNQPALVKEYEYAKNNGFNGDFMSYQRTIEAISKAVDNPTVLTAAEAQSLGLPASLVGKTDAEIIKSLNSPKPPKWWIEANGFSNENGGDPTGAWNIYRADYKSALDSFARFRTGLTANQTFKDSSSNGTDPESLFGS